MKRPRLVVLLAAATLAAPVWAQTPAAPVLSGEGAPIVVTATEADYARVVGRTVKGYIVPAHSELERATGALDAASKVYCAAPDAGRRNGLADDFGKVLTAWAGVDFLRFGPMARDGRYERFAYWPDVHGTGTRQLRRFLATRDQKLLDPGALARQSAAVQGLPALEQLLYSGTSALTEADPPDAFRCALAVAVTGNLHDIAGAALADWQKADGWAALLAFPGPANPVYRTHAEAMTEVLKGVLTGLEQTRDQRLLPAVGASLADAQDSRAPYARSGRTLGYFAAEATALRRYVDASGILGLLPGDQKGYGASVAFEFGNLDAALASAGPDIAAALADGKTRSRLVYAGIVLQSLRDLFQRHVALATGLTAGFNSMDGD